MKIKKISFIFSLIIVLLLLTTIVSATDNNTQTNTSDTTTIEKTTTSNTLKETNKIKNSNENIININSNKEEKNTKQATLKNANMILHKQNKKYADPIKFNITVTNKDNTTINSGRVLLYLDGQNIRNSTVKNSQAAFTIGIKKVGTYQLQATYTNTNYNNITKTNTLTVTQTPATLTMNNTTYTYQNTIHIKANVKNKNGSTIEGGQIDLYLNNTKIRTQTVKNSNVDFTIGIKKVGTYQLQATYTNTNYKTNNKTATLTVNKASSNVTVNPATYTYGQTIYINSAVVSSNKNLINNGKIELYLNNEKIRTQTPTDGHVKFKIGLKKVGKYQLRVKYINDQYWTNEDTTTLTVNKASSNVTINNAYYTYGETIYVYSDVVSSSKNLINNGKIELYLNNEKIRTQTPINGHTTFKIGLKKSGTYQLKVKYINDQYWTNEDTATLTVYKADAYFNLNDLKFKEGQKIQFSTYIRDENYNGINGGKAKLYLDGNLIRNITPKSGDVTFTIGLKKAGTYQLKVEYDNPNYYSTTKYATLKVSDNYIYVSPSGSDYYNDGTISEPFKTLSYAIENTPNNGKIRLLPGTYSSSYDYNIDIDKNITIDGNSSNRAVLSMYNTNYNLFNIHYGFTVKINNVILEDNYMENIIDNDGYLICNNITFRSNNVDTACIINNNKCTLINCNGSYNEGYEGSIVYNNNTLLIKNSTFTDNWSELGGVIYSSQGTVKIYNSDMVDNTALSAGSLANYDSIVNVYNSKLLRNSAKNWGGSIVNIYGSMTLSNTSINNNNNSCSIYNMGQLTITNSQLNNNNCSNIYAGALYNEGITTITNTRFNNNSAECGGAIANYGSLKLNKCNLTNNVASESGGAIYNKNYLDITNSNLKYNEINHYSTYDEYEGIGGAVFSSFNGTLNIKNSNISYNSANYGGAISFELDDLDEEDVSFYDNGFSNYGAESKATITNSKINHNYARYDGAAIANGLGIYGYCNLTIDRCELNNNEAGEYYDYEYENGFVIINSAYCTIKNSKINNNYASAICDWMKTILSNTTVSGNIASYNPIIESYMYVYANNCTFKNNDANYLFKTYVGQGNGYLNVKNSVLYNPSCYKEIFNDNDYGYNNVHCDDNWWGTSTKPTNHVINCVINSYNKGLK